MEGRELTHRAAKVELIELEKPFTALNDNNNLRATNELICHPTAHRSVQDWAKQIHILVIRCCTFSSVSASLTRGVEVELKCR